MWSEKHVAYEKFHSDPFAGDAVDTIVVSKESGKVIGHLRAWENSSVMDDWDPKKNGLFGTNWRDRPKGWRKCRNQEMVLDWTLDALSDW